MESKLKEGINPEGFHNPDDYETLSVEKAFEFLKFARDNDYSIFSPQNYFGFLSLLVLKCDVDINYVFDYDFEENIDEIKLHVNKNNLPYNELEKEVERIVANKEEEAQRRKKIIQANERYAKLTCIRKILQMIAGNKPSMNLYLKKTNEELDELYVLKKRKKEKL